MMASILSHTDLPLWVWTVIIIVGALTIIGTTAFIVRLIIVRQRKAGFLDTFGDDDLPQRKVTVRRGRVVEHSRYLSLTGSRFGLNMFGANDNDTTSRAGARSKSPFEWWSSVQDRSQSRNSQHTQMSNTNDTNSVYGMPGSPLRPNFYQRRDLNVSNTSLASTFKDDSVAVSVTEASPAKPLPAVRNFSRSFSRPLPYSKYSPRQQQTLSCIEESSPHTSMISTRQSRITSLVSNKRDTKSSTRSSNSQSPVLASLFPQPPRWSTTSGSKASSIYHEADNQQARDSSPNLVIHNDLPSSLDDIEPGLSQASHRVHAMETVHENQPHSHSNSITALPEQIESEEPNSYWATRKDLKPVRTISKKGNVLRKKSLKKQESTTSTHL